MKFNDRDKNMHKKDNCINCFSWMPDFFFNGHAPTQGTCKDALSDSYNKTRTLCYSCAGYKKREKPNPVIRRMNEQYRDMYQSWMNRRGDGIVFETNQVETRDAKQKPIRRTHSEYLMFAKKLKDDYDEKGWKTRSQLKELIPCHKDNIKKMIAAAGVQPTRVPGLSVKYFLPDDVKRIQEAYARYLEENPRCRNHRLSYHKRLAA